MTPSPSQQRWLASVTLPARLSKTLIDCRCNCTAECRICGSFVQDEEYLRDIQIREGVCICSFGDCLCVTFHALLYNNETETGDSLAICGTKEVRLTELGYENNPGHAYTAMNSRVNCPACLKKKRYHHNTGGGGWAFPFVPDLSEADKSDINRWAEWANELNARITARASELPLK